MLPVDRTQGVLPVEGDPGVLPVYWTQVCCL